MTIADYTKTVEDIQSLLSAGSDPGQAELKAVYDRYVTALNDINSRLRKCDDLLQKGHRGEAIQLCEMEPTLLEAVSVFDFPEANIWSEFVQHFGFRSPPQVLIDVAADLNEAYAVERPLERLMRSHRLLALGLAPLKDRLAVLRQIAAHDPGNPIWHEDIRTFEEARQREMATELQLAAQQWNVAAMASILQELEPSDWIETPADQFVKQVRYAHEQARRHHARIRLQALEKQITEAYSAFDLSAARQLKAEWDRLQELGLRGPSDPLLDMVAPAFEWLVAENQKLQTRAEYDRLLTELQEVLDRDCSRQELDRAYAALQAYEWGVPQHLERRARDRIENLERETRVRSRMVLASILAFIFVTGGVTVLLILSQQEAKSVAGAQSLAKPWIDRGEWDAAKEFFKKLEEKDPDLFHQPELQGLLRDLEEKRRHEEGIVNSFQEQANQALKLIDAGSRESLAEADQTIVRLKELAKAIVNEGVKSEKEMMVEQLASDVADKRRALQNETDAAFEPLLSEFKQKCEKEMSDAPLARLRQLYADGSELAKTSYVSDDLRRDVSSLLNLIRKKIEEEGLWEQRERSVGEITDAVGDLNRYRVKLAAYVQQHPGTEDAEDFKEVLKEFELWREHEKWLDLTTRWSKVDFRTIDPAQAKRYLKQLDSLSAGRARFPQAEALQRLRPALEAITRRDDNGHHLKDKLEQFFNSPAFSQVYFLRLTTDEGDCQYYFRDRPKSGTVWGVDYYVDASLNRTEKKSFRLEDILNPRKSGQQQNAFDWTSPQARFATFALTTLAEVNDRNWEHHFGILVAKLLDPEYETNMDSILRLRILQEVIDNGSKGSAPFAQTWGRLGDHIKRQSPNYNAWIIPNDETRKDPAGRLLGDLARQERDKANQLIEDLRKSFVASLGENTIAKNVNALRAPDLGPIYEWTAWLCRDRNRNWACHFGSAEAVKNDQDLFVLERMEEDQLQYVAIGRIRQGKVTVNGSTSLLSGKPVFSLRLDHSGTALLRPTGASLAHIKYLFASRGVSIGN